MDPITTMIVTALALGAAAGLKTTAEQAVKDAYAGVKALIQRKYADVSLAELEEAPESEARRAVVEEDLAKTDADKDEELLQQARALIDVVEKHDQGTAAAIGIDLEDVEAAYLKAGTTGVKVKKGRFKEGIEIDEVRAGKVGGEDPNP